MRFDRDYSESLVLRDGTPCVVRMVRPEDRHVLREGMAHYSSDSLYWRFMSVKNSLTEAELDYLTQVDGYDHFALVAGQNTPDGPVGFAVARFVRVPGSPDDADFALFVGDPYQGIGLGKAMMDRLVAAAKERGVKVLVGEMFAQNSRMFGLAKGLGLPVEWQVVGPVATCRITVV
ncbi:MAG: GNAT family N-acetyltransferase [Fimbriimonadaceae bacterium]|nr:GNAT family N-acetyltransferase [Fimbriimonadaceae bacterium]